MHRQATKVLFVQCILQFYTCMCQGCNVKLSLHSGQTVITQNILDIHVYTQLQICKQECYLYPLIVRRQICKNHGLDIHN